MASRGESSAGANLDGVSEYQGPEHSDFERHLDICLLDIV